MKRLLLAAALALLWAGCDIFDPPNLRSFDLNWDHVSDLQVQMLHTNRYDVLFGVTETAVWRSADQGTNWRNHYEEGGEIVAATVSPANGRMYISVVFPLPDPLPPECEPPTPCERVRRIYQSLNKGTDWENTFLPGLKPLAADGVGNLYGQVILDTAEAILPFVRYTPVLNGWDQASIGLEADYLFVGPQNTLFAPRRIYDAFTEEIVWEGLGRSYDRGSSWTTLTVGGPAAETLHALAFGKDGTVLASIGVAEDGTLGLYRSTNFGDTWQPVSLAGQPKVTALLVEGDHVFAGTENGLFFSTDGGLRFTSATATAFSSTTIRALTMDSSGFLYAATRSGIYRSQRPLVNR